MLVAIIFSLLVIILFLGNIDYVLGSMLSALLSVFLLILTTLQRGYCYYLQSPQGETGSERFSNLGKVRQLVKWQSQNVNPDLPEIKNWF